MPEHRTRTEYRVVVGAPRDLPIAIYDCALELDEARRVAREERGQIPVRIQHRTVTSTPWEDVPDA